MRDFDSTFFIGVLYNLILWIAVLYLIYYKDASGWLILIPLIAGYSRTNDEE